MSRSLLQRYNSLESSTSSDTKHNVLKDIINATPAAIDDDERQALVQALLTDIAGVQSRQGRLGHNDALDALVAVKILGRSPSGSSIVVDPANLEILYSLVNSQSENLAMEAFRCLANALLLNAGDNTVVQIWVSLGGGDVCIQALEREPSPEYSFLICRCLFLLTLKESPFIQQAVESKRIVEVLGSRMKSLFQAFCQGTPFTKDALIDIAKTSFNLMLNYPRIVRRQLPDDGEAREEPVMGELFDDRLSPLIVPLLQIYNNLPKVPRSPLPAPLTHIIHALINVPIAPYVDLWFSPTNREGSSSSESQGSSVPNGALHRSLDLLGDALSHYVPGDPDNPSVRSLCEREGIGLDDTLAPLVILLTRMVKGDENARKTVQNSLLPPNLDRSRPLEQRADTLGRCLRLLGSVYFPRLKDTVGELLYAVGKSDARFMSSQIGYGNAAGFLMNHGVMGLPEGTTEPDNETENLINPITGTTNVPIESPLSTMTEEEREREAERLFVLFNRLERMGMAVNPVRQAQHEGRLEDL